MHFEIIKTSKKTFFNQNEIILGTLVECYVRNMKYCRFDLWETFVCNYLESGLMNLMLLK